MPIAPPLIPFSSKASGQIATETKRAAARRGQNGCDDPHDVTRARVAAVLGARVGVGELTPRRPMTMPMIAHGSETTNESPLESTSRPSADIENAKP